MPEWNQFIKKYCIEADDLPIPHGPNVVVIETIDTEEAQDPKTKKPYERHLLFLVGWRVPLRLNNTRIQILQKMFGPRVEDCFGKKIALMVAADNQYGDVTAVINIHPFVPDQAAIPVSVPTRLAVEDKRRLELARVSGVPIGAYSFRIGPSQSARTPEVHSANPGATLGEEAAAKLMLSLRERGKNWDWAVGHLSRGGMGAMVQGKAPPDCEVAIRQPLWAAVKDFPIVVNIDDRAAEVARLVESWKPPANEVIDPHTGEVIPAKTEDDIPF